MHSIADLAFVLRNGRIAISGLGPELLSNPELKRAYMGNKQ
jgi:ABC-type branched-subunit amino acid transport system ATPase component